MSLLGVHLGDEKDLLGANEQNERGFWENAAVYRLNEELLEGFGASWYRPPDLPPGWAQDARLDEIYDRATRVVEGLAAPGRRWGFKDPRTIVLLPFWRRVIGDMDYLICIRRAPAVVSSVQAAGFPGTDPRATAKLWLDMNAAALGQTVGERRMFVFYDEWFEDPRRVATRLATFIHGDRSTLNSDALDAVEACFDRELRRADAREAPPEILATPELDAMYAHMQLVAAQDADDRTAREREALVARGLADGYGFREAARDDIRRAEEESTALRDELDALRWHTATLARTHDELQTALTRHQLWLEGILGSTSWKITAPLRAAKHGVQDQRRARHRSALPTRDQSLLGGWSVRRVWWLAFVLSSLIGFTDAILDNSVILIALLSVGPCCGVLTGRWTRTATIAIWTVALAVLLCIPDEIWDTRTQLVNVGAVVAAGLLSTTAASFIERSRYPVRVSSRHNSDAM
jgi:hypothetical protein